MTPALLLVTLLASPATGETGKTPGPLTVEDCVRVALRHSARIDESEAKVREYEARLAEVESLYYPKLAGLAYLAPMYTVEGDIFAYDREWKKLSSWGPYTHLEATLAQPLYSFGRIDAGKTAANERAAVERARLRETENTVAFEVRRLFFQHMYALSILPTLDDAAETIGKAQERAQELYEQATGEVTQADLSKLRYGELEVRRYHVLAIEGAAIALAALKHTMGLAADADLQLAADKLPPLSDEPLPELATLLVEAAEKRPEWAQVDHGKKAAAALADSERMASLPVLFLAGQLRVDWAPTRDNPTNPYHYDPYNGIVGGIALGVQFSLDIARASARADQALATLEQVEALGRFAATGIPLQVRKAYREVEQARQLVEITSEAVKATRKWMTFSASAYNTGTGEARDVLEGLATFVAARRNQLEALRDYHLAQAQLLLAVGRR